jgi:hypothetical protein
MPGNNDSKPMLRLRPFFHRALVALPVLLAAGCATTPPPVDPLANLLAPDEKVAFRAPAQLLHGHDMEAPPYGDNGYQPIPAYRGELAVTDRRLLFAVLPQSEPPLWVSIPFAAIARARPSRTPLLNYIVVWDQAQHPDAFLVDARQVRELHRQVGQILLPQMSGGEASARHSLPPR